MLSVAKSLFMVFNKLPQNDFEAHKSTHKQAQCFMRHTNTTCHTLQSATESEKTEANFVFLSFFFFAQVIKVLSIVALVACYVAHAYVQPEIS